MVAESARTQSQIRTTRKLIAVLSASTTATAIKSVKQAELNIRTYEKAFENNLDAYKNTVFRLAGYRDFALSNLQSLAAKNDSSALGKAVVLVQNHTMQVLDGESEIEQWRRDILEASQDMFSDK